MDDLYRKTARAGAQLVVDLLERLPGDLPRRPMETTAEDYRTLPTRMQRREFLARGNEFL
jgi:predicted component of type VI protein secretion system